MTIFNLCLLFFILIINSAVSVSLQRVINYKTGCSNLSFINKKDRAVIVSKLSQNDDYDTLVLLYANKVISHIIAISMGIAVGYILF